MNKIFKITKIISSITIIFTMILLPKSIYSFSEHHSNSFLKQTIKFPPPPPSEQPPKRTIGTGARLIEIPPNDDESNPNFPPPTIFRGNETAPNFPPPTIFRGENNRCIRKNIPLTPLIPQNQNTSIVKTAETNPTIYIYIPETIADNAEFILVDSDKNTIFRDTYKIPFLKSGIITIEIPETISLSSGKKYYWEFAIICNPDDRNQDQYLNAGIEIIELSEDFQRKLELEESPLEKAKLYAAAGIWPETLINVAQLRSSNPQAWFDLLISVGLEEIVDESFLNCCNLEDN